MHDVSRMFMVTTRETQESSRFPNNKQRVGPQISAHDFAVRSQDNRDNRPQHTINVVEDSASDQLLIVSDPGKN